MTTTQTDAPRDAAFVRHAQKNGKPPTPEVLRTVRAMGAAAAADGVEPAAGTYAFLVLMVQTADHVTAHEAAAALRKAGPSFGAN